MTPSERTVAWQRNNRERYNEKSAHWRKNNPRKHSAHQAHRRAAKRVARCTCCKTSDLTNFYLNRPAGFHVDHVIPLVGGGKHCLSNLQYLTAHENLLKGTKF